MPQHDHDQPMQRSGAEERMGAGKGAPEATLSDGGTHCEDEAIFHPVEEETGPLRSEQDRLEHDRVTNEASDNSVDRDIAAEAAEPGPAPRRRKKNRQLFTLLVSTLGLAATIATVGAFYLRDKDVRFRAFSAFVEKAVTHPETLVAALKEGAPKWLGGAGETGVSAPLTKPKPAARDAQATPPDQGGVESSAEDESAASKPRGESETPRENEERSMRPAPAPATQGASGKPTKADEAEALGKRVDQLEQIARSALAVAEDAHSSADKALSAKSSTPAQSSEDGTYLNALEGRIDELASEISAVKEKLGAPKSETRLPQEQTDAERDKNRAVAIVVVTQSLIQALDRGRPFASEYAALAALGADSGQLTGLEPSASSGAPTARQLLDSFAPVAKRLSAMDAPPPDASYADRLLQGVSRLVKIRRPGAAAANSISDVVARIEAALTHGDVAAAADAFAKLPDNARSEAREWGEMLRRRRDAEKAADSILSGAIGALGRTKG